MSSLIKKIIKCLNSVEALPFPEASDHCLPKNLIEQGIENIQYYDDVKLLVLNKRTEVFHVIIYLLQNNWTVEQINQSLFYIKIGSDFVPQLEQFGLKPTRIYKNVNDFIQGNIDMNFDVILQNPPYSEKVGPKKTEPIWQIFVLKMLKLLKEDGIMLSIHPTGWRAPQTERSKFKEVQKVYLENQLLFLSMNDYQAGNKTFGVGTAYDVVILKNKKNDNTILCEVENSSGEKCKINLNTMDFIPEGSFDKFLELLPKEGEDKINLLYSRSAYGSDKNNMSHDKDINHVYPCVYTIGKSGEPRFMFSNTKNNGHFDIPKVIWSNGAASIPVVDSEGQYGLTQFSYAIVDEKDNLEKIKKALENKEFLKLMKKVSFSAHKYNFRVISCFKKDWWKSFV